MLQLYGLDHDKLHALINYKDLKRESTLDGEEIISFSYPQNDLKYDAIKEETYIRTKDNEYVIKEINQDDIWSEIVAKVNVEAIKGKNIDSFETVEETCTNSINLAIAGTGWTIGNCDVVKKRTVRKARCSAYDVIQEIANVYKCEFKFDAINKKIYVYQKMGDDKGVYFSEQLNLKKLGVKGSSYDYCTRIIPIGKDGLNIKDINGGKEYVENYQYSTKIITVYWEDNRYTDAYSLMEDAILKLDELSTPTIAYSAEVLDLAKLNDKYSNILSYGLGDTITLLSKDKKVREKQRIVKLIEYLDEPEKNSCEIANRVNRLDDIEADNQETIDSASDVLTSDGGIDGSKVDSIDATTQIRNLDSEVAKITNLYVINANIQDLYAHKASVDQLNATDARIGTLEATTATITQFTALQANVNDLKVNKANISDLSVSNGRIAVLESNSATINNLLAGNLTAKNMQTGLITADSGLIANGAIKDAMILSLSVEKILAGDISTTKFRIVSDAGNMLINDNTIQIKDNSRVRVQIGKDASNDYNMYVWDSSGNLMFDAAGLKASGIKDKIIRDDMVSDTANINGSKIEKESLVTQINGATTLLKASKIKLDTENQTLDIAFTSLKSTVTNTANIVSSQGTSISTIQGQISTKIWQQDITTAVDNITIGGRNLIDTAFVPVAFNDNGNDLTVIPYVYNGISGYRLTQSKYAGWGSFLNWRIINKCLMDLNVKYSFSVYAVILNSSLTIMNMNSFFANEGSGNVALNTDTQLLSTTGKRYKFEGLSIIAGYTPSNSDTSWHYNLGRPCDIFIAQPKLEIGSKCTDYTPSPEDVQSQIDKSKSDVTLLSTQYSSLNQSVNNINATVSSLQTTTSNLGTRMSNAESTINIQAGQIATKVTQADIDNSINGGISDKSYTYIPLNFKHTNETTIADDNTAYTGKALYINKSVALSGLVTWGPYFTGLKQGDYTFTARIKLIDNIQSQPILKMAAHCNQAWYLTNSDVWKTYNTDFFKPGVWTYISIDFTVNNYMIDSAGIELYIDVINRNSRPTDIYIDILQIMPKLQNSSNLQERVINSESSISQLSNSISLKVNTSDFTSYQTTVNNNLSIKANQSDLNSTNSNVSSLTTRVSTAESSINVLQNQINLKVTQTDINNSINNLQIGTRNLVPNSNFYSGLTNWGVNNPNGTGDISVIVDSNFGHCAKITAKISYQGIYAYKMNRTAGKVYSWSAWMKADSPCTVAITHELGEGGKEFNVGTTWTKYTGTGVWNGGGGALCFYPTQPCTAYVANVKYEEGNKPTDWTPAPEDVQGQIDSSVARIASTESSISLLQNQISLKVTQTDINKATGINTWLVKMYKITGQGGAKLSVDTIKGYVPYKTFELGDTALSTQNSYDDNYVGYATTFIYLNADYSLSTTVTTDDDGAVYLNNSLVVNTVSCQSTSITLNFKAGWNQIDVLWGEGAGGDGFYFGSTLSRLPQIIKMSCYYNINSVSESRISSAESNITQLSNSITLKVNTSDFNSLTGRVSNTESNISILQNQITSKVSSGDLSSLIAQNVNSVQVAFNNIGYKVQITNSSLDINDSYGKKAISFTGRSMEMYDYDTSAYLGYYGVSNWLGTSNKGLTINMNNGTFTAFGKYNGSSYASDLVFNYGGVPNKPNGPLLYSSIHCENYVGLTWDSDSDGADIYFQSSTTDASQLRLVVRDDENDEVMIGVKLYNGNGIINSLARFSWNGNHMHRDLDMHGYNLLNVGKIAGRVNTESINHPSGSGTPIDVWTTLQFHNWVIQDVNVKANSIQCSGSKNRIVKTNSYGTRALNAVESADCYFTDIGEGLVTDGKCIIPIDPIFKETVNVNIQYQVFLTKYGKGELYVTERNSNYFVVEGDNIGFGWEIKAKQKDYENTRLEIITD